VVSWDDFERVICWMVMVAARRTSGEGLLFDLDYSVFAVEYRLRWPQ